MTTNRQKHKFKITSYADFRQQFATLVSKYQITPPSGQTYIAEAGWFPLTDLVESMREWVRGTCPEAYMPYPYRSEFCPFNGHFVTSWSILQPVSVDGGRQSVVMFMEAARGGPWLTLDFDLAADFAESLNLGRQRRLNGEGTFH